MITPDILANIEFYATENGGRKGPTPSNFFGCVFVINENNYDARLLLQNIGSIFPGDKKTNIPVKFLSTESVLKLLSKGSTFHIRDGQIIGIGEVTWINDRC